MYMDKELIEDKALSNNRSIQWNKNYICKVLLNTFKDTHREKAPSNKTPTLRKITNMGIWTFGTLNQLFMRGS